LEGRGKSYEEDVKEYQEAVKSRRAKKAFVITGSYKAKEGSIVDIIIKPKRRKDGR
jgi:hypothetical protein